MVSLSVKVLRLAKWMSLCSRVSLLLERDTFVRREVAARSRAGGQEQGRRPGPAGDPGGWEGKEVVLCQ